MDTEQANNPPNKDIYEEMVKNPLPPMTLRIGVAGHRDLSNLSEDDMKRLREEIEKTYTNIYDAVQLIATDKIAKSIYANDENANAKSVIRITSSLAEGADRLCIEPDIAPFKYELACILPFPATKFIHDFSPGNSVTNPKLDSVTEFYAILERIGFYRKGRHGYYNRNAPVIELDGNPANRDEAYNNCSHLLVEHSDILIAVYDGKDNNGNGTDAAVKAARKHGIPIIHIPTKPNTPIRLHCSTRFGHPPCDTDYTTDLLQKELQRVLLFLDVLDQEGSDKRIDGQRKQKILGRFKQYQAEKNLLCRSNSPIDFDDTGPIELTEKYEGRAAKAFDILKKTIATPAMIKRELSLLKERNSETTASEKSGYIERQLSKPSLNRHFAAYLRADRLANYYASIHRSTFVLIYLLGALALIAAVSALAASENQWKVLIFVLVELGLLTAIFSYYRKDHREKYHDRWLEYRCLAEFLRPMHYLSLLGRPYAISNFRNTEEYLDREIIGHSAVGRSWLYIYTETISRWSGFNACRLDSDCKHSVSDFITTNWLNGQISYHTYNAATMRVLGRNLGRLSFCFFIATVIFVIGKLIMLSMGLIDNSEIAKSFIPSAFAWLVAILPMCATTAYAIRNHAEFDISAQRSLTMRAALIFRRNKLNINQTTLTSSQMTDILDEIATITIKETADWLEIYEVKESELG